MKIAVMTTLAMLSAGLALPAHADWRHHRHHNSHDWRYAGRTYGRVTPETPNGEYSHRQSPYTIEMGDYPQWAQNALGRDRSRH